MEWLSCTWFTDIPEEEAGHILDKILASRQDNKSSMCRDVLNKKQSEMDFINGMVVKLAKKHNIDVPVNTAMVYFVKALESKFVEKKEWILKNKKTKL